MKRIIFFTAVIFAGLWYLNRPKNVEPSALDTIKTTLLTPQRSDAAIPVSTNIPSVPVVPTLETR